MKRIHRKKN